MSGHMTRMSRGSSVVSSVSRPSSTSRSTSIWRAGPWQLCTCTERSVGVSVRPCGRTALAAMSDCSQPSRVSGWSRSPAGPAGIRRSAGRRAGCVAVREGRGRGWPAAGGRPRGGWCRRGGGSGPATSASCLPQVVAGVRQPQVKVVVGGQRVEQFDLGGRQPGVAEEREPLRQVGR